MEILLPYSSWASIVLNSSSSSSPTFTGRFTTDWWMLWETIGTLRLFGTKYFENLRSVNHLNNLRQLSLGLKHASTGVNHLKAGNDNNWSTNNLQLPQSCFQHQRLAKEGGPPAHAPRKDSDCVELCEMCDACLDLFFIKWCEVVQKEWFSPASCSCHGRSTSWQFSTQGGPILSTFSGAPFKDSLSTFQVESGQAW